MDLSLIFTVIYYLVLAYLVLLREVFLGLYNLPIRFKIAAACFVIAYYALMGLIWVIEKAFDMLCRTVYSMIKTILVGMLHTAIAVSIRVFQTMHQFGFQVVSTFKKELLPEIVWCTKMHVIPFVVSLYRGGRHMRMCSKQQSSLPMSRKARQWCYQIFWCTGSHVIPFGVSVYRRGHLMMKYFQQSSEMVARQARQWCRPLVWCTEIHVIPFGVSVYHKGRLMIKYFRQSTQMMARKACDWCRQTACPFILLVGSLLASLVGVALFAWCRLTRCTLRCTWAVSRISFQYIAFPFIQSLAWLVYVTMWNLLFYTTRYTCQLSRLAAVKTRQWCQGTGSPILTLLEFCAGCYSVWLLCDGGKHMEPVVVKILALLLSMAFGIFIHYVVCVLLWLLPVDDDAIEPAEPHDEPVYSHYHDEPRAPIFRLKQKVIYQDREGDSFPAIVVEIRTDIYGGLPDYHVQISGTNIVKQAREDRLSSRTSGTMGLLSGIFLLEY